MKKFISTILIALFAVTCLLPFTSFASDGAEEDIYLAQSVLETEAYAEAEYAQLRATGLIIDKNLKITKSGTVLVINGKTTGSLEVKKCGFTKVVVQRKKAGETSWANYITYEDLYSETNSYNLNKSLTVASGYQYRVTATHYAKKSLFSTQKIDATTGYLTF